MATAVSARRKTRPSNQSPFSIGKGQVEKPEKRSVVGGSRPRRAPRRNERDRQFYDGQGVARVSQLGTAMGGEYFHGA